MKRRLILNVALIAVGFMVIELRADTYATTGGGGDWTNSLVWGLSTPCYPINGGCISPPPAAIYEDRWFVTYNAGYGLPLDVSVTLTGFTMNGGTGPLGDNAGTSLTVKELFTWQGGSIWTGGSVTSDGLLTILGGTLSAGTSLFNNNIAVMNGLWRLDGDATNPLAASWTIDTPTPGGFSYFSAGTFHNNGLLRKTGADTADFYVTLDNNATGEFRVEQGLAWLRDPFECDGTVDVWPGATLQLQNDCTFGPGALVQGDGTIILYQFARTLDFTGTWNVTGLTYLQNGTVNFLDPCVTQDFEMCAGILTGDLTVNGFAHWIEGDMSGPGQTTFNGDALLDGDVGCGSATGTRLINRTIQLTPGQTATIAGSGPRGMSGAVIDIPVGAALEFDTPPSFRTMAADPLDATIENDGLVFKYNSGNMYIDWLFNNRGLVHITDGAMSFSSSGYVQTAGEMRLDGGELISASIPLEFQGGRLTGSALIGHGTNTNLNNNAVIAPGFSGGSAGLFHITGTLTLLPGSVLEMDLGGLTQGTEYDAITSWIIAPLDGELQLRFAGGFENNATDADTFVLLEKTSGTALTGAFTNVASGADLETADGKGVFTIHYGAGSPFPSDQLVATNFRPLCPADTNGDGNVGVLDFLAVLAQWGAVCPCSADITGPMDGPPDGNVGILDFLKVLANWGACP